MSQFEIFLALSAVRTTKGPVQRHTCCFSYSSLLLSTSVAGLRSIQANLLDMTFTSIRHANGSKVLSGYLHLKLSLWSIKHQAMNTYQAVEFIPAYS
jgi:hypothetical protein